MWTYIALWGLGLVIVILGFFLEYGLIVLAGFLLGALGFFTFVKRNQGTRAS